MVSYNPHTVMHEMDEVTRHAAALSSKARNHAVHVARAKTPQKRERALQALLERLSELDAALCPALLTQWRQEHAEPRQKQEPPGLPDGLICKKCGEQKEPADFLYDDGYGHYGYTHRCFSCRRAGRKGQPGYRVARKENSRRWLEEHPKA